MIDYIYGPVAEITPTYAVVDCTGIGYEINITLIDYGALRTGEKIKFYIHESIREDAHILYGFLTKHSRELFRLLLGVSGVGPSAARLMLSSMTSQQLEGAISSGNEAAIKAVKGIGAKTAQRIIVDLKDKIKTVESALINTAPASETYDDALAALTMLGFTQQQSRKALDKLFKDRPDISVERAIKQALTML